MNATNAGWFLVTGILLGVLSIVLGIGRRSGSLWMTVELVLLSVVGSFFLRDVSAHLPGGWFAFVYTGVAFAVITQAPKWFFSTGLGSEMLGMIGDIPPVIFVALIIGWSAWYLALFASSQFFIVPMPMVDLEFASEASLLTLATSVSVIASILGRHIRVF